jgi:hypothetical protein
LLRKNLENYVGKDVRKHDRVHDVEEAECERDETEGEESTGRSDRGRSGFSAACSPVAGNNFRQ